MLAPSLNSLHVITFEDDDTNERLDIHIPSDRISKDLKRLSKTQFLWLQLTKKNRTRKNAQIVLIGLLAMCPDYIFGVVAVKRGSKR